jgi:glycosyltransferase involved in cell wall biosynthesis
MSELPLVSILIPCYNAQTWVRQSVESALAQTYSNKEVIVVDDGSTDGSLAVLRSFGDAIQVETGPNLGGNVARNRLLALSKGKWLSYLDADDYLMAGKVDGQMQLALSRGDLDVVYSPIILRNESTGDEETFFIDEKEDAIANYLGWSAFSTNSLLLRRAALAEAGGWKESQKVCQEHEMLSRLIIGGCRFALYDVAGTVYRFHGHHTVSTRSRETVVRQRMILTDLLAEYLYTTGQLTEKRRSFIARARLESARSMYRADRVYARSLMQKAVRGGPIAPSPAAPLGYRATLALLGFDAAETLAACRRRFVSKVRQAPWPKMT